MEDKRFVLLDEFESLLYAEGPAPAESPVKKKDVQCATKKKNNFKQHTRPSERDLPLAFLLCEVGACLPQYILKHTT